jgi:hypothetical protein
VHRPHTQQQKQQLSVHRQCRASRFYQQGQHHGRQHCTPSSCSINITTYCSTHALTHSLIYSVVAPCAPSHLYLHAAGQARGRCTVLRELCADGVQPSRQGGQGWTGGQEHCHDVLRSLILLRGPALPCGVLCHAVLRCTALCCGVLSGARLLLAAASSIKHRTLLCEGCTLCHCQQLLLDHCPCPPLNSHSNPPPRALSRSCVSLGSRSQTRCRSRSMLPGGRLTSARQ